MPLQASNGTDLPFLIWCIYVVLCVSTIISEKETYLLCLTSKIEVVSFSERFVYIYQSTEICHKPEGL